MNSPDLMQPILFTKSLKATGLFGLLFLYTSITYAQGVDLRDITGFGQTVDLKELTGLLELPRVKLETHLQKRGFKRDYYASTESGICFTRQEKKEKKPRQSFRIIPTDNDFVLSYQTRSAEEYDNLKQELTKAGYVCPKKNDSVSQLYQRWGTRIESHINVVDSTIWYELRAERKELPKMKDIVAAEDLLQLDAHQYLEAVFGRENVKQDVFYYTENETNRCSVIFPNSDMEAIFVWNDEVNMKDLAFILIGGTLKPRDKLENVNAVAPNSWHSRQGIFCGMTIREMELLNKQPIRFYNWRTESAGYLAPGNRGKIDFNNLGVVFNCLNCGFTHVSNDEVLESANAIANDQKVFVKSLIILPEKKNR
jgi:hypothetical protein